MSFTEDELQAFNAILEQRFAAHRQEMEQALDQRLAAFQQGVDQQFASLQQEFTDLGQKPGSHLTEKLDEQQHQITHTFNQEASQKAHQVEATVDRMLAAQLLGIEQLLNQYISRQQQASSLAQQLPQQLEAIEVQTELSWEDLAEVIGKALDERLTTLNDSLQRSARDLEQYLAVHLHSLRDEIARGQDHGQAYGSQVSNGTSVQEMLAGIEHLDRVMESMQVAMTANHALLSNRLYHHQQLPLERAHPVGRPQVTSADESASLLAQARERIASGLDPEIAPQPVHGDEPARQE